MLQDIIIAASGGEFVDPDAFKPSSPYSRVYVERAAFAYPLAQKVLARLPDAEVISIKHYKDIFNHAGQDFSAQKDSPKLILAVREKNFVLPGAEVCDHYGHGLFYYSTQMMNCPYNCAYCYLRGMYPSGNIAAFVNTEDYFEAARQLARTVTDAAADASVTDVSATDILAAKAQCEENSRIYLSVSYDSDLLALEQLFGFASGWVNFARDNPRFTVEIRTKSAALPPVPPAPNVILSWTVTPQSSAALYEKNAPSVSRRLEAARAAVNAGWRVRLCADPVLALGDWEKDLTDLLSEVKNIFQEGELEGVTVGGFRMSKTYFKRIAPREELLKALPLKELNGVMRYTGEDEERLLKCYTGLLRKFP